MAETLSFNVRTEHAEVFVVLNKVAVKPHDPESGLTVEPQPRPRTPSIPVEHFYDLAVKFMLNMYPEITSEPTALSHPQVSLMMRQKVNHLKRVAEREALVRS